MNSMQKSARQLLLQEENTASLPYTQLLQWFMFYHEDRSSCHKQEWSHSRHLAWVSQLRLSQAEGSSRVEVSSIFRAGRWHSPLAEQRLKRLNLYVPIFKMQFKGRGNNDK